MNSMIPIGNTPQNSHTLICKINPCSNNIHLLFRFLDFLSVVPFCIIFFYNRLVAITALRDYFV